MSTNSNVFEIRLKSNGKIFSRHYVARTAGQAAKRANNKGRILSVKKVHSEEVIGTIKSMNLQDIIGVNPERRQNVVFDNTTIEDIVFSKRGNSAQKKRAKRRFNNARQGSTIPEES